jgi:hypothetical protein
MVPHSPAGPLSGVEVGQHGQHAAVVGLGGARPSLLKMLLLAGGLLGDEQPAGDGGVRPPLGHRAEDLALTGGELAEWFVPGLLVSG